jgi:hypothetical protein
LVEGEKGRGEGKGRSEKHIHVRENKNGRNGRRLRKETKKARNNVLMMESKV